MRKAKFSGFVKREIARFEKQLEDGLWDDDMTDKEIDEWHEKSAREREAFMKEHGDDVETRVCVSPYDMPQLEPDWNKKSKIGIDDDGDERK